MKVHWQMRSGFRFEVGSSGVFRETVANVGKGVTL